MKTKAQLKLRRSSIYLVVGLIVLALYIIATSTLMLFQLMQVQENLANQQIVDKRESEKRLAGALQDIRSEHKKTQAYIRCVATVLLKPVAARTEHDFDKCGIDVKSSYTPPAKTEESTRDEQPQKPKPAPVEQVKPSTRSTKPINPPVVPMTPAERPDFIQRVIRLPSEVINAVRGLLHQIGI